MPPAPHHTFWRRKGFSEGGERVFDVASWLFVALVSVGWFWSIENSRGEVVGGAPSATGIITRALTDSRSPKVAYLTDAALEFVNPLRGESGKLRAALQQPGESLAVDTLPHGASVTFSSGAASESTTVASAPGRTGIWSVAVAIGNAIRPVTDFSVITLKPASAKRGGKIGFYYIGNWPSTKGRSLKTRYEAAPLEELG